MFIDMGMCIGYYIPIYFLVLSPNKAWKQQWAHLVPRSWVLLPFTNKKELELLGGMADSSTKKIWKMSLEHFIMAET
jgi:hypothetical protein